MDLGVTVLTSLGGGHFDNLTGSSLDDNVAVLSQGRTLKRVSQRSTSIGGLEGVVVIVIGHTFRKRFKVNIAFIFTKKTHIILLTLTREKIDEEEENQKEKQ